MRRKKCSICNEYYWSNQIETIYDNGTKKNCCQFCLEGVIPSELHNSMKFIINYNRLTGVSLRRLVSV